MIATPETKACFRRWNRLRAVLVIVAAISFVYAGIAWFVWGMSFWYGPQWFAIGIVISVNLLSIAKNP